MKCSLCNKNINENDKHSYDPEEGNYHCEDCMTPDEENSEN